jgi:hypothetical protein
MALIKLNIWQLQCDYEAYALILIIPAIMQLSVCKDVPEIQ